jgi:hypothetical protein
MKTSSSDLSTYRRNLGQIGFNEWSKRLAANSKIVVKGGRLLPKQLLLLNSIYRYFVTDQRRLLFLSAPPASGKTHIICLVAADLATLDVSTAIVVPSSELLSDFKEGLMRISELPEFGLDILTMQAFLRVREDYEMALLDEAHNVRSSFELNREIYRVVDIADLVPHLNWLISDGQKRVKSLTKVIDGEEKENLLRIVYRARHYKWLRDIYRSRSMWIAAISSTPTDTKLHLLIADPNERRITARSSTIMISATPLDDNELELYCGIDPRDVCRLEVPGQIDAALNCHYFAPKKVIESACAFDLALRVLSALPVRSLILLNKPVTYRKWFQQLKNSKLRSRAIGIGGGDGGKQRSERYSEFMSKEDSILVTNSTVFWEGINIKQLRLLIIGEKPNPRPNLIDIYSGKSRKFLHIVQNRMMQGIGRIGRIPQDNGVCVIMFPYEDDRVISFDWDGGVSVEKTARLLTGSMLASR